MGNRSFTKISLAVLASFSKKGALMTDGQLLSRSKRLQMNNHVSSKTTVNGG